MSSRGTRDHTRESTKIDDFDCGVSSVISPFTRNDKTTHKTKKIMTTINLTTKIKASKQIVFDASRNIDIHQQSASSSKEKAISGVTSGLINLNETVTWRGKHFGFYFTHIQRI